jgi:hypothetical protein
MNDSTLRQLKVIAERAVRPVRASVSRKRRMREELLAHLVTVFEEEDRQLGDEQAAIARAAERFGDPAELAGQLQQAVPRLGRLRSRLDDAFTLHPGESLLRFVGRQFALMFLGYAVAFLLLMPLLAIRGRLGEMGLILHVVAVAAVFVAAFSSAFLVMATRIGRALFGRGQERSVLVAIAHALASLPLFPALAFLAYWGLTWDAAASLAHARMACWLAPAAPVTFLLMGRQVANESLHEEEWTSLEIDG